MFLEKILIEVISHKAQRYPTAGDWQFTGTPSGRELLHIRVSDTGDDRSNMLVALHELVEALLCREHGVSGEVVDAWDMGPGAEMAEPGDCPTAPYHREHRVADIVERLVAYELISWMQHEHNIEGLYNEKVSTEAPDAGAQEKTAGGVPPVLRRAPGTGERGTETI